MKIVPNHDHESFTESLLPFWVETDKLHNASPDKTCWGFLLYEGEEVVGGIGGYIKWDWFYIQNLIVSSKHRGNDYGTQLIKHAEAYARTLPVEGMYLATLSFQAPDFYKKMGFVEHGRLVGCPKGADLITLHKRFEGSKT